MSTHSEEHPLNNFIHSQAILNSHWHSQPFEDGGSSAVDVKSYLNTLYPSPMIPMTALRSWNFSVSC